MDLPIVYLSYGLLVVVIVLMAISLGMVVSYFKLLKSYDDARKRQQELEVAARAQADQVVRVAQKQAEMLLDQARAKAGETISAAEIMTQQSRAFLEQSITAMVQQQGQVFTTQLGETNQYMQKTLETLTKAMHETVNQEIHSVVEGIGSKMSLTQAAMQKNLMETYQRMEGELEVYKKQRMADYEKTLQQNVRKVVELALKRTLTAKDQEHLVLEALDNAERNGVI